MSKVKIIETVECRSEVTLRKLWGPIGLYRIRLYTGRADDRWTVWQVKVGSWTFGFSPAKYDSIFTYPFRKFMGEV